MFAGIDPGLTRTGVVIKDEQGKIVDYATFSAPPAGNSVTRVTALAAHVVAFLYCHGVSVAGLETAVYNRNPKTFALQSWLIGALMGSLAEYDMGVVLVGPTQAKAAHTGDGKASKLDMILAGSFDGPGYGDAADQEALADAEAMCDYAFNNQGKIEYYDGDACKINLPSTNPDIHTCDK